jgi:hypothetical protein
LSRLPSLPKRNSFSTNQKTEPARETEMPRTIIDETPPLFGDFKPTLGESNETIEGHTPRHRQLRALARCMKGARKLFIRPEIFRLI